MSQGKSILNPGPPLLLPPSGLPSVWDSGGDTLQHLPSPVTVGAPWLCPPRWPVRDRLLPRPSASPWLFLCLPGFFLPTLQSFSLMPLCLSPLYLFACLSFSFSLSTPQFLSVSLPALLCLCLSAPVLAFLVCSHQRLEYGSEDGRVGKGAWALALRTPARQLHSAPQPSPVCPRAARSARDGGAGTEGQGWGGSGEGTVFQKFRAPQKWDRCVSGPAGSARQG